jgi:hypothetical protein
MLNWMPMGTKMVRTHLVSVYDKLFIVLYERLGSPSSLSFFSILTFLRFLVLFHPSSYPPAHLIATPIPISTVCCATI